MRQSVLSGIGNLLDDKEIVSDGRNIFFPKRHSRFTPVVKDEQFKLEKMDDCGTPPQCKGFACTED